MRENSSSSGLEGGVLDLTYEDGINTALNDVLEILDTLQEQPVKDNALFDSCLAKVNPETRDEVRMKIDKMIEQPVELEKEIKETFDKDITTLKSFGAYSRFARHFYELGRQGKPKVSEDVEEAAKAYADDINSNECLYTYTDFSDAFKAGAKWQKAQSDKELSEKIASAYQLGLADKEKQMMDEWLKDRDGCFWDGVEEGKKAMREQLMKEAVEGEVVKLGETDLSIYIELKEINQVLQHLGVDGGDRVKLIIVKED